MSERLWTKTHHLKNTKNGLKGVEGRVGENSSSFFYRQIFFNARGQAVPKNISKIDWFQIEI